MKVATMRRVDAVLGVPLCALLTVWRKFLSLFARRPSGEIERVLFVKLAEQGSTVLAYPALKRAVDRVGAENVYFLVFEENRFILDAMEVVPGDNVVAIRTSSLIRTFFSALGALWRLRGLRLDAAFDLEFFARSTAILTYLTRSKRRIGLHAFAGDGPWRGDLMTHRMAYNPHLHTSRLFDLLVCAAEEPPERFPAFDRGAQPRTPLPRGRFLPSEGEVADVAAIVREATGLDECPSLVLLNANCGDLLPLRRWSEASYVDLARRLLDAYPDLWIGLTGAPTEAEAVAHLAGAIDARRCVSFAGRTTLRQLLVLYGLAELLVTNDSGPAHFASLTPIDVIALFGPETPELFGVLSDRSHVVWAETACSPCVSAYNNRVTRCRDNVCMQRIGVEEVFREARAVLERRLGNS